MLTHPPQRGLMETTLPTNPNPNPSIPAFPPPARRAAPDDGLMCYVMHGPTSLRIPRSSIIILATFSRK